MTCRFISLVIGTALWGGLSSCSSYSDKTKEMREAFGRGEYDRALTSLKDSGSMDRSQDRLLWRLEAATIYDRKGDTQQSKKLFFEADGIADELYTTSISSTAASFVVSDASADYDGEDYEKVAIHTMLAHQFLGLGDIDGARVEAKKINNKLAEINQRYDEKNKNKYGEDAHGRYLAGLIYESRDEWDDAIIDYGKAIELYEGAFSKFVKGGVPKELVRAYYRILNLRDRKDKIKALELKYPMILQDIKGQVPLKSSSKDGEIVVIHEVGRVAPKTEKDFVIPVGRQVVRFSYPVIHPQFISSAGTGLQINGSYTEAENTVYMDAIASDVLESKRGRMIAKNMARLLVKGQINDQVGRNFGPLAGLAANVVTAVTETADTRSWTTLPQGFFISRIRVPAGEHSVTVKSGGRMGIKVIHVKPGKISFLRSF